MNGVQKRMVYTSDFIKETVLLVLEKGISVSQASEDLEIGSDLIYSWIRKYKSDLINSFSGKGHLKSEEERIRKLERKLSDVKGGNFQY
jgi:transposase